MATFTAEAAGNWTSNVVWGKAAGAVEGTNYPGPDDNVALATFKVDIDIPVVPSTGRLGTITASGGGYLAIALDSATFHTADPVTTPGCTIYATDITPGTVGSGGFIVTTGTTDHSITIDCAQVLPSTTTQTRNIFHGSTGLMRLNASTKLLGGAVTYGKAAVNNSTGKLYVTTPLCLSGAGTGAQACSNESTGELHVTATNITGAGTTTGGNNGVYNNSTGPLYIYAPVGGCTITGGTSTGGNCYGIWGYGTGTVTFDVTAGNINFVDGTKGIAYAGPPIVWTAAPAATSYMQGLTYMWVPVLAEAQIKKDVVSGGGANEATGTYDGGFLGATP